MKKFLKKIIPSKLLARLVPFYHRAIAFLGALRYRFPSREIVVIGITGTKGKTTTVELLAAMFQNAGYKTALSNSLRFKVGHRSWRNTTKTSMPGRAMLQKLLRHAVQEKCDIAIIEMTSEGAKQFRHAFIDLDAFVFLNIAPEHIESHGSFERYLQAKVELARALTASKKKRKILLLNRDYEESKQFLALKENVGEVYTFSLKDAEPYRALSDGIVFRVEGKDVRSPLLGEFNIKNAVAASATARVFDVPINVIQKTLTEFKGVRGRVEKIELREEFDVYVDYAHTPDSFEALFKSFPSKRIIAVFGSAGGGRDIWKRPALGRVADSYAAEIILTTDDPYDDDPKKILDDIAGGIRSTRFDTIVDRREAIREALRRGRLNTVILILGMGAGPYQTIAGVANDWDDARVVREEHEALRIERLERQDTKTEAEERVFTKERKARSPSRKKR